MEGVAAGTGIGSAALCAADDPCMPLKVCVGSESVWRDPGCLLRACLSEAGICAATPFARGGDELEAACNDALQSGSDLAWAAEA